MRPIVEAVEKSSQFLFADGLWTRFLGSKIRTRKSDPDQLLTFFVKKSGGESARKKETRIVDRFYNRT